MSAPGFKLEKERNKPTMKQKVRHVLRSRGRGDTQRDAAERAVELVEELVGQLARSAYDRASLSTHTETTMAEVARIKRYVDTILFDLLEVVAASS